jgi:hypothetical protein
VSQQPCAATTQRGTACRSFVPPGRTYCVMHDPAMAGAVATARVKGGQVAARLRLLQGKRLRLDTAAGVARFTSGVIQDTLAGTIEPDLAKVVLYGCSIQLKAAEMIEKSEVERRLAEVEKLLAQRRAW